MNAVHEDYRRSAEFVDELLSRLRLSVRDIWCPNTERNESGVDVGVTLTDETRIGIQVTEIDPFPIPGQRGCEKKKKNLAGDGAYGSFAQNDLTEILRAVSRAIKGKTRNKLSQKSFNEFWLLLCTGVPDFPGSTFVPTAWIAPEALTPTAELLSNSCYAECFVLAVLSTEMALYKWSRTAEKGWRKIVYLEEVTIGAAGDAEYVRELLRTCGTDKSVVDAQVRRILSEMRSTR